MPEPREQERSPRPRRRRLVREEAVFDGPPRTPAWIVAHADDADAWVTRNELALAEAVLRLSARLGLIESRGVAGREGRGMVVIAGRPDCLWCRGSGLRIDWSTGATTMTQCSCVHLRARPSVASPQAETDAVQEGGEDFPTLAGTVAEHIRGWSQRVGPDYFDVYSDDWFRVTRTNPLSDLNDPPLERITMRLHRPAAPAAQPSLESALPEQKKDADEGEGLLEEYEAAEEEWDDWVREHQSSDDGSLEERQRIVDRCNAARSALLKALRAASEPQQQEPAGWADRHTLLEIESKGGGWVYMHTNDSPNQNAVPLYRKPPQMPAAGTQGKQMGGEV